MHVNYRQLQWKPIGNYRQWGLTIQCWMPDDGCDNAECQMMDVTMGKLSLSIIFSLVHSMSMKWSTPSIASSPHLYCPNENEAYCSSIADGNFAGTHSSQFG